MDTVVSRSHKKLMDILESIGLELVEEIEFPPFTVDIYVPEIHIGIECDGPMHRRSKDIKRDAILLSQYSLPIFRVKAHSVTSYSWIDRMSLFFEEHTETANERLERCKMKMPLL